MNKKFFALVIAVIAIILAFTFRSSIKTAFEGFMGNDYPGPGGAEVVLVIDQGETGESIATAMAKLDIVKDANYTYKEMIRRNQTFIPGSFQLLKQMKTSDALDRLEDTSYLVVDRVTIKEGLRIGQVFDTLSAATGIPVAEFKAVTLADLGLPKSLPSIEGYLFPATYDINPGSDAKTVLKLMIQRMDEELLAQGVSRKDRHSVLTLASIIQKEARLNDDFYKVSRVFKNRIKAGMYLQSDATVSYGSGGTTVTTTDAERADPNGYNTYVHLGLPVGPISAPGAKAIDAALHPANGEWLYFCAVNLQTGETVFSDTYSEHLKAVAQWQKWMRENPGWNG